jgi:hypothetical protein
MFILLQVHELRSRYTTYSYIPELNLENEVPKKAKVSKAMRAYLERAQKHGELYCIRKYIRFTQVFSTITVLIRDYLCGDLP